MKNFKLLLNNYTKLCDNHLCAYALPTLVTFLESVLTSRITYQVQLLLLTLNIEFLTKGFCQFILPLIATSLAAVFIYLFILNVCTA